MIILNDHLYDRRYLVAGQFAVDQVAVVVFHCHQREEGAVFVRTVFSDYQRRKTQLYRTVQRSNDIMAVRIFTEPDLFALKQYWFFVIFIHFRQREQTALLSFSEKFFRRPDKSLEQEAMFVPWGMHTICGLRLAV